MAGRGPCRDRAKGAISRPALTRTQMMRAAQTSAVVQQRESRAEPEPVAGPSRARQALSRPPPKKIDFAAPQMTKALAMRQQAAADKIRKMELEKEKAAAAAKRRPRRTPAPVGGDARLGRAGRSAPPAAAAAAAARKSPEAALKVLERSIAKGNEAAEKSLHRASAELDAAIARGHIVTERSGARSKRAIPGPSGLRPPRPRTAASPVSENTRELARLMNAEIVQAVPISDGPVDKIIIDPGAVKPDRSTIVCIPQPAESSMEGAVGGIANKSIQAISETLNEQDAAESAAVQGKLEELQNARREFVIAVANVSGNAVNVQDVSGESILNIDEAPEPLEYLPSPPRERQVVKLPDVSHVMFQVQYGLDHPDVEAARRFSRRAQKTLEELQAQKRMEDVFERAATQQIADFDLAVPLEQELQEGDISLEEDEQGLVIACPSRIKASMRIPRRSDAATPPRPVNIDELERFFDLENYPPEPEPNCPRAPLGRENVNPDLWDIEDPWYHEKVYDDPPLIQFDTSC